MTVPRRLLRKIVSGGQSGVDRAALDASLECGIPIGGWCPRGRKAEDGDIDSKYPLCETKTTGYSDRTEFNVRDSDGTLIITSGPLKGGTSLTASLARQYEKPCLVIDPDESASIETIHAWLIANKIQTLNIAGPRESGCPGIYEKTYTFVRALLSHSNDDDASP
ncbi:MAG: putative molybdenum carrier protein [Planctomycetota bacterium]|nr:putative molybdenum carrier protein [Planctomycetota bacterium]